MSQLICPNCGNTGSPKTVTEGSITSASSAGAFQITEVIPSVSGSVQTTVFDGSSLTTDVPSAPLRVDPERQIFDEDLGSTYIA